MATHIRIQDRLIPLNNIKDVALKDNAISVQTSATTYINFIYESKHSAEVAFNKIADKLEL